MNNKEYRKIMKIMIGITLFLATLIIIRFYGWAYSPIIGQSMYPTIENHDKVIISVGIKEVNKNDIISVKRNDLSIKYIIKRVIGVENDKIEIKDNKLYINDILIQEDYINEPMVTADMSVIVPIGKVFIVGDNRNYSLDSRSLVIGLVDVKTEVYGKAIYNITKNESM